jgi:hypothetical protein
LDFLSIEATEIERNPAADEAEIAEIVGGFLALQARTATEEGRPLHRGVHAKGICVKGVFEVLDVAAGRPPALAARLARGIYLQPGAYPATVRFSNADAGLNADWKPDLRGLAFSVELAGSGCAPAGARVARQDYSLQSAPTSLFNDVRALVVFAKVFGAPNQTVALASLPFRDQLIFAHTMAGVRQHTRQPVRPYQQLRYWSAAPFRHGPEDVVKYSAWPAAPNSARQLEKRNPDALRDELIRHLHEDATMSSFDFGLQLLDPDHMTYQGKRRDAAFWIENAAVEWPEAQAPFHTVARLTLVPKSQLCAEAGAAAHIDVARHTAADSAPLGGINRMRSHAVAACQRARLGASRELDDSGMRGST